MKKPAQATKQPVTFRCDRKLLADVNRHISAQTRYRPTLTHVIEQALRAWLQDDGKKAVR